MSMIRLAEIRYPVTTLGPGTRLGVWLQGCHIGCSACMSRDTWDPGAAEPKEVDEVIRHVLGIVDERIDGITISGGEPFEQPAALAALIDGLRDALVLHPVEIDVLCYSGFSFAELERSHPALLARLDAIIPEPFLPGEATDLPWRGSANQPLVALSAVGKDRYGDVSAPARAVQLDVSGGHLAIVGIPRRGDLARVERKLAAAGIRLQDTTWRP